MKRSGRADDHERSREAAAEQVLQLARVRCPGGRWWALSRHIAAHHQQPQDSEAVPPTAERLPTGSTGLSLGREATPSHSWEAGGHLPGLSAEADAPLDLPRRPPRTPQVPGRVWRPPGTDTRASLRSLAFDYVIRPLKWLLSARCGLPRRGRSSEVLPALLISTRSWSLGSSAIGWGCLSSNS